MAKVGVVVAGVVGASTGANKLVADTAGVETTSI